ncbi:MAG: FliM/FliN family flagellar motor C-terminal domain-containing protein [Planctomycetota bacterium]|jgi:flagellar motor switch protein FliN/FliY
MPEKDRDIESLTAEVGKLADEVITEVVGEGVASNSGIVGHSVGALTEECCSELRPVGWLEVPVIVRLAEGSKPISELINLQVGALLEFEKPADSELDLMINNQCIGRGRAVTIGERFGLQLTEVGPVGEGIGGLGGQ